MNWACVNVAVTKSNSNDIRSVVKSIATNCIKAAIAKANSNHIISTIMVATISDKRVVVIRTKNNLSINYTIINRGIKRTTTHFVYDKKLDNVLI